MRLIEKIDTNNEERKHEEPPSDDDIRDDSIDDHQPMKYNVLVKR